MTHGHAPAIDRARSRRARFEGVLLLLAISLVVVGWHPASANATGAFSLFARSDVATVEYYRSDVPVVPPRPVVFHSPSTAQAALDSLGTSESLASAPDPGAFARELPEETAGVTGGQVAPPAYPFAVRSSFPTEPEENIDHGAYQLHAASEQRRSAASASATLQVMEDQGLTRSQADAVVTAADDTGTRVAEATARLDTLTVGDLLHISDVRSRARLILDADGTSSAETSTTVGAITVNGIAITLDEGGISVDDDTLVPIDPGMLAEQLRAADIELRYLPAVEQDGSVQSAAIEVSWAGQDPSGAQQNVVVTLGRVSVTGTASVLGIVDPVDVTDSGAVGPPDGAPSVAPQPSPLASDLGDAVQPPALDTGMPAATASPMAPTPTVAAPSQPSAEDGLLAARPAAKAVYTSLFSALALAGIAAAVSSRLLGLLGVRLGLTIS